MMRTTGTCRAARALLLAALVGLPGLTAGLSAGPRPAAAQNDEHPSLPPGEGRDLMIRVCSKCHAPEQAAEQQNDLAGWKALVDQMASKGAEATDAEFDAIVHYLAASFPPSK